MEVQLNRIDGISDAIKSIYVSKRNLTPERNNEIDYVCDMVLTNRGAINFSADEKLIDKFTEFMDKTFKIGKVHMTVLSFIDLSYVIRGLHRAGQDDWDSHAKRFDNRIIRESTRLATFDGTEKSDYYKGKILTMDEAINILNIDIPDTIMYQGQEYVRATNGYIKKGLENINDVKRGLYMECIPSTFIFKCNLAQFAHVYKMRNKNTCSNPEVRDVCECCVEHFKNYHLEKWINRELLEAIPN